MANYNRDFKDVDFDAIRLSIASPEDILSWSYGEVTKPETINYRTQKPERDGLFCEKIFGPIKDINPHDNRYKGVRSREAAVDKNGELVTKSAVRRERMGHISLAAPVAHMWFMRGTPSAMSMLLGLTVKNIEKVVYFASYIIIDVDTEKRDQMLKEAEDLFELSKQAIKKRYSDASDKVDAHETETDEQAELDDLTITELAKRQAQELEQVEAEYKAKKNSLEKLIKGALLSEKDYRELPDELEELIEVGMGAKALKKLLDEIDLEQMITKISAKAEKSKGQAKKKILKRLKMLENMNNAGIKPNYLTMTVVPVIPPELRPMVQLAGGRFATSDLNDLYRRVINRNNRLKKLLDMNAPEVICRNEMRMLQEAVDSLIDNSATRGNRAASSAGGRRKLKSLSDSLKGKQGRFRQNLLGKRVDYSGRSVIVVGPELKINQCGLPNQMALELFKPFVISWLIRNDYAPNIRSASRLIEAGESIIWDALEEVIQDKYVLLNRAPSLHRLSIQAFQPILVKGQAIQLHPLVANGFNADYDGDQMAVHLPLSKEAQLEAKNLMTAQNNLLKPADGSPVLSLTQDIVLGNYYLTYDKPKYAKDEIKHYTSVYEAEMAYENKLIGLQSPIRVHTKGEKRNTTLGRVYFNEVLPKDLPYQNEAQSKKQLKKVLAQIYDRYGAEVTTKVSDDLKDLAFKYATIGALSAGKDDYVRLPEINDIIKKGEEKTNLISDRYEQGLLTDSERHDWIVDAWRSVDDEVTDLIKDRIADMDTSLSVMVDSGARGTVSNVKLASANIGVMVDVLNNEIELPVKSSFLQGLSSLEAYVATRGARNGLVSTALKTADSGYLTRRLVDVAQDIFTISDDEVDVEDTGYAIYRSETEETMVDFSKRLFGRYAAEDVKDYVKQGELITKEIAQLIEDDVSIDSVKIKSILSAKTLHGIPQKSYGIDMATNKLIKTHEPVGVIAAQSLGEPGTQLTLNTFHNSGVAGGGNISQGLPRVEELFEARKPKGQAYIAEVDGVVDIWEKGNKYIVQVTPEKGEIAKVELKGQKPIVKDGTTVKSGDILTETVKGEPTIIAPISGEVELVDDQIVVKGEVNPPAKYSVPSDLKLIVHAGQKVEAGDKLTNGSYNLQDLMKYKGIEATERYIINEVLRIYAAQGQDVSAKHLEIIVKQMFSRVQIEEPGDSTFATGEIVSKAAVIDKNVELANADKELIGYKQLLLGISKVSIWSDSFLSAASFQDTTRVLINAATSGRIDYLHGLKENVIIGHKIPVGTGVEAEIEQEEQKEYTEEDISQDLEF